MRQAIRNRAKDFIAVVVLIVLAAIVAGYVLSNQRFFLPAWVPLLGKDFYEIKAEFETAQAISPGQGQTVNIAGVPVGEIGDVQLKDGRAVIQLLIQRKYAEGEDGRPAIYRNATMLLRPRTGLNDMTIQLDPGDRSAGRLPEGGTLSISNTLPNVNPDQVLASLDADTRTFLQLLLGGAGEGLDGRDKDLSATIRRFEPTARDTLAITEQLSERRASIARVISNFRKLSQAVAGKDTQLSALIASSNTVFSAFAAQDANLRATIARLPDALDETRTTLGKVTTMADLLGPTLQALRPGARALGPSLEATQPFLRDSTPVIRDQLRPFTKVATPIVEDLSPAIRDLNASAPNLVSSFRTINYALDELAFNPQGSEEGFLFWLAWANHAAGNVFSAQDAHGPIRRGLLLVDCGSLAILNQLAAISPQVGLLLGLLNPPGPEICPANPILGASAGASDGGRR